MDLINCPKCGRNNVYIYGRCPSCSCDVAHVLYMRENSIDCPKCGKKHAYKFGKCFECGCDVSEELRRQDEMENIILSSIWCPSCSQYTEVKETKTKVYMNEYCKTCGRNMLEEWKRKKRRDKYKDEYVDVQREDNYCGRCGDLILGLTHICSDADY